MQNYLGFDLGTGAIKAVLWHPKDGMLKTLSERVSYTYPAENFVEFDLAQYFQQVLGMINKLAAYSSRIIAGISFAAASGNTVLCDSTGLPLLPCISWLDKRLAWTPPSAWNVREVSGWPAIPSFPLMHLEWLKREKEALLKDSQIAMNNDYICWQLCGERVLDHSSATPFYLQNQEDKRWHKTYLDYYGISEKQLPKLVKPGTLIGSLKNKFTAKNLCSKTTKVYAGSFDHPSAARAAGIVEPGEMLLSCGTSWVGFYPVKKRNDVPLTELCDPFQSGNDGCWGAMFSLSGVGIKIEKFIEENYQQSPNRYDIFNEEAKDETSSAYKLMKSVVKDFAAKLNGRKAKRIVMVGGPSEGESWRRILSEELQQDIETSEYKSYAGAVGAAMLAGGFAEL